MPKKTLKDLTGRSTLHSYLRDPLTDDIKQWLMSQGVISIAEYGEIPAGDVAAVMRNELSIIEPSTDTLLDILDAINTLDYSAHILTITDKGSFYKLKLYEINGIGSAEDTLTVKYLAYREVKK